MKEYVLITGASSGIGLEMAKQLAAMGYNLILVARRADRLENLKLSLETACDITVVVLPTDLSVVENSIELFKTITARKLKVTMLVNNAGFGDYGDFLSIPLAREIDMINVNVTSLVVLTKLFLVEMKKNNCGKIMNIASLLSYLPFPYYSVYSATKAFVLAFTETLAAELEGTRLQVKALCPAVNTYTAPQ